MTDTNQPDQELLKPLSQVADEMAETAWRLLEASKTANGKPATTAVAKANRTMAYTIKWWEASIRATLPTQGKG